jgi:hypothetical protein
MLFYIIEAVFLSIFSVATLLYVSLATGIGPWIAPLLVCIVRMLRIEPAASLYIVMGASCGAAIATGIGFSIPTLYFVDRMAWDAWMAHPTLFSLGMMAGIIAASMWGVALARRYAAEVFADTSSTFPTLIAIQATLDTALSRVHALFLGGGIFCATAIGVARNSVAWCAGLPLFPVYAAAGFLAGTSLVIPLLLGVLSRWVVVWPLMTIAQWMPEVSWAHMSMRDVTWALCLGLMLSSIFRSVRRHRLVLYNGLRSLISFERRPEASSTVLEHAGTLGSLGLCIAAGLPPFAVVFILFCMRPLLRHLLFFFASTGLAPYGRYMTVMMLPLVCIPGISSLPVVLVCGIIGIAGSSMIETVSAMRLCAQYSLDSRRMAWALALGISVSACVCGGLLWALCTVYGLGIPPLLAHRGLSRALVMNAFAWNGTLVALGCVWGMILDWRGMNAALMFGGLIMPAELVFCFVGGGIVRHVLQDDSRGILFWSGVLVGDVMLLVATAVFLGI